MRNAPPSPLKGAPDPQPIQLVLFSKQFPGDGIAGAIRRARDIGIDGYDLCVRSGHAVEPVNVETNLPKFVMGLRKAGVSVPLVTTRADLIEPNDPDVIPLLRAMDRVNVRHLKIGYFRYSRAGRFDYARELRRARAVLGRWEKRGRRYRIKICYHLHASGAEFFLGSNAAALMELLHGFDPEFIGAYLDAGHLALAGEPFDVAAAMVRKHLAVVAVKDGRSVRPETGPVPQVRWEHGGKGIVDWECVFNTLARENFSGPVSIHAFYSAATPREFLARLPAEVAFFRNHLRTATDLGVTAF